VSSIIYQRRCYIASTPPPAPKAPTLNLKPQTSNLAQANHKWTEINADFYDLPRKGTKRTNLYHSECWSDPAINHLSAVALAEADQHSTINHFRRAKSAKQAKAGRACQSLYLSPEHYAV